MDSLNKVVLITGAGGFIGSNIVDEFLKNGFKILAIIHKNVPKEFENIDSIELIKCDVTDNTKVKEMFDNLEVKPDIIVHVAGLASDVGADIIYKKLNFESVKNVAVLPCKKFIYISSTDVYGIKDFNGENEEELPFCEFPKNPYPKYKIESEKWLRENLDKNKFVIIRPAAVWGKRDKTLETRFIDFLKSSPIVFHFGKWRGANRWPLANVETLAKTVYNLTLTNDYNGQAVNIIDSKKTSLDDYYRQLMKENFPNKKYISVTLPMWFGKILGFISSTLSYLLGTKHPIFDPSYYALHHISSNLDFDNKKMLKILNLNNY